MKNIKQKIKKNTNKIIKNIDKKIKLDKNRFNSAELILIIIMSLLLNEMFDNKDILLFV